MPVRAPASMDMLQTVMRPSMDISRKTEPVYSMACPMPPDVPIFPMMARMTSLGVTPAPSSPSTRTSIVLAFACQMHCVAKTCSTSDVPMPNAIAPTAPCVAVWLSPQTMIMPGCVRPCSGPMTWTMPCFSLNMSWYSRPNSSALCCIASSCAFETSSERGLSRLLVGTLWSATATVLSSLRMRRLLSRRPSNAWGEVTSWTRCRST